MRQQIFFLVLVSTVLLATGRSLKRHRAFVELVEDGNVYRGKVHVNGVPHHVNLRRPDVPVFSSNFHLTEAVADRLEEISYRDITPSEGVRAMEEPIFIDDDAHAVFKLQNDSGSVQLHGIIKNMHISHDGENHFAVIHEYPGEHDSEDYLESNLTLTYNNLGEERGISKANPELLVTIDFQMWSDVGKSDEKALEYVAIMFHGANRRFQTVEDPQVVFKIVNVVIIKDRSAQPFIERSKISSSPVQYNMSQTLGRFGAHMYEINQVKERTYDLAALITGEYYYTLGITLKKNACRNSIREIDGVKTKIYAGVLVVSEIQAAFTGVFIAAHELGHTMGSPEDGDSKQGMGDCPQSEGYIMSNPRYKNLKNVLTFSKCSRRKMKSYTASDQAVCLRTDESKTSKPESTIDPGNRVSLDQQCAALVPLEHNGLCSDGSAVHSSDMDTPENLCKWLICECDGWGPYQMQRHLVLDGTPCNNNGTAVCQEGKCVNI